MLTPEQKEARKAGIGGSDVAAILGLSPWKSAHMLYLEKRGEWEEPEKDSEVIHFGNVLEDVVANEYARRKKCRRHCCFSCGRGLSAMRQDAAHVASSTDKTVF